MNVNILINRILHKYSAECLKRKLQHKCLNQPR